MTTSNTASVGFVSATRANATTAGLPTRAPDEPRYTLGMAQAALLLCMSVLSTDLQLPASGAASPNMATRLIAPADFRNVLLALPAEDELSLPDIPVVASRRGHVTSVSKLMFDADVFDWNS
jgi:hypothetical protein